MSGFKNNSQDRVTYVNIVNGKLAIRGKEGEIGPDGVTKATSRVNKNQETVWEFLFDEYTAVLEDVIVEKSEALKAYQYKLIMNSVGEKVIINVPCDSKYGDHFAKKFPNIKVGEMITIRTFDFKDKANKSVTGMNFFQPAIVDDANKVQSHYTKENPNGFPALPAPIDQMTETKWKIFGMETREFLRLNVEKQITAYHASKQQQPGIRTVDQVREDAKNNIPEDDSDLPF